MSQNIALWGLKLKPGEVHRIPMVFRDFKITNVSFGEEVSGSSRAVIKVHHIPHYGHPAVEEEDLDDESDDEEEDEEDDSEDVEIDDAEIDEDEADDDDDDDDDEEDDDEEEDSDAEDIRDMVKAEKSYTERTFVLCTLTPGKVEQAAVNLAFNEDEDIGFSVTGDNEVDLLGNYTVPVGADQPPYSDDEDDSDSDDFDSDEYDSEIDSDEVGDYSEGDSDEYDSDEIDMDGLEGILAAEDSGEEDEDEDEDDSRIEELGDAPIPTSGGKKRKAADDVEAVDVSMTADVTDSELARVAAADRLDVSKLSKSQRKRLNKKLKTAGAADADVSIASTSSAVKTAAADGKVKTAVKEKVVADGKKVAEKTAEKRKLASGLTIEVKKAGSGAGAKKGEKIGMRYIGKLATNGKVFDSNTKGKPFSFKLGRGEVIKAWDEGVLGMTIGEERRLTCPPATAYGSRGAPPDIPKNATLVFDIKRTQ